MVILRFYHRIEADIGLYDVCRCLPAEQACGAVRKDMFNFIEFCFGNFIEHLQRTLKKISLNVCLGGFTGSEPSISIACCTSPDPTT